MACFTIGVDLSTGWELLCHVFALFTIITDHRHSQPRNSTLKALVVFSIIRVTARSAQIAAAITGSDALTTITRGAGFFSVPLFLLTAPGILSQAHAYMLKLPFNHPFMLFMIIVVSLYTIAPLTYYVTSVAWAANPTDTTNEAAIDDWITLYLTVFIILIILAVIFGIKYCATQHHGESTQFHAIITSLPLILLYVTYVLLAVSNLFGGLAVRPTLLSRHEGVFLGTLSEILIVYLFLCAFLLPQEHETRPISDAVKT